MDKIPIEITPVQVGDGIVWTGKIPLQSLNSGVGKRDMDRFVARYSKLVKQCQTTLKRIEREKDKNRRAHPARYWEIGDHMLSFIKDAERTPFFANGLYQHLRRDTGKGSKLFQRCLRFRQVVPKKGDINPERTWSSYRSSS